MARDYKIRWKNRPIFVAVFFSFFFQVFSSQCSLVFSSIPYNRIAVVVSLWKFPAGAGPLRNRKLFRRNFKLNRIKPIRFLFFSFFFFFIASYFFSSSSGLGSASSFHLFFGREKRRQHFFSRSLAFRSFVSSSLSAAGRSAWIVQRSRLSRFASIATILAAFGYSLSQTRNQSPTEIESYRRPQSLTQWGWY